MATSYKDYTGNQGSGASSNEYAFTFPSLAVTDVKVEVDEVLYTNASSGSTTYQITGYNSTSGGTVVFNSGSIPTLSSQDIRIYRDTDVSTASGEYDPQATYSAGSSVKAGDLNLNQKQALYAIWEEKEQTITAVDLKDNSITSSKIAGNAINSAHLADNSVGSSELQSDSVGTTQIKDNAVTSAKIAGDAVGSAQIADGAVGASELAANAVGSAQIADGAVGSSELAANSVNSVHIADGAVGSSEIAADAVGAAQIADGAVGSAALAADSVGSAQISDGAVGASEIAANAVGSAQISDGAVGSSEIAADAIQSTQLADNSVAAANIAANAVGSAQIADGAVGSSELASDSVGTTQIKDNAVTIAEVGCEETTITDDDTKLPTSGAVVDYVSTQISNIGGLKVVATDAAFPTTANQPASGVVISIADAGGVVFNGSGVSTTGRTTDGTPATVTISGAPSSLYSETIAAGVGMQVSSTGSGNNYTYHKILATESDVKQLSDDINDFNERYRIGTKTADNHSSNHDGDLFFDTSANKMYVYDGAYDAGGSWGEVTSTGEFKILGVKDNGEAHNGAGPTFNGTDKDQYDLFEGTSDASITQAAQLIVVLNGVVQKPNDGSFSDSAEGFYLDGADGIRFCDPPPNGSTLFVIKCGSAVSINVPADNSVTAGKTDISLVQGDVIYANGTDSWTRLAKGTAGQVLKMNSGATAPEWGTDSTTDATKVPLAGGTMTGDLILGDNVKLEVGDASGGDLQIYHDGTNTQITNTTGSLIISDATETMYLQSDVGIRLTDVNGNENFLIANDNGSVELYHDNSKRIETTAGGCTVTGTATVSGLHLVDDDKIKVGSSDDLQIYHDGSNTAILNDTGQLTIASDDALNLCSRTGTEYFLRAYTNNQLELFFNNTIEFATKSGGVKLYGHSECAVNALGSVNSDPTFDFTVANYITLTLTGNVTVQNPTTESVGQSGSIIITQDGTGSRTCGWSNQFKWTGGTAPTLSTAAGAVDRIDYLVVAADTIHCVASLDVK